MKPSDELTRYFRSPKASITTIWLPLVRSPVAVTEPSHLEQCASRIGTRTWSTLLSLNLDRAKFILTLVGATRFERATSSTPWKRATKLRHAPTCAVGKDTRPETVRVTAVWIAVRTVRDDGQRDLPAAAGRATKLRHHAPTCAVGWGTRPATLVVDIC